MNLPVTELDRRFSDPEATAVDWGKTREVIEQAQLFWIATVRSDGRPHVTPLVAVWLDDALHFTTGATEQKYLNLAHNPHVTLTTGCNQWDQGLDVVVEGDAVPVTDDETLTRLAAAWAAKWDGSWRFEARDGAFHSSAGGASLVFRVMPVKVLSFAKGTFGHTRHRFTPGLPQA